ncbi:membrane protein insertase YidC [Lactobacillus selangorensis]|nr:membrane protein insertase YidC [Lactobacillus selangorensis]
MFVLVAAGCSTTPVTSHSTGFWDRTVIYNFSQFILWLSKMFGGNYGWGIIVFTIIIRIIILPLTWWQTKSMEGQQAVAPQLQALQKKYPGKDAESRQKLQDETQKLYAEAGVNPVAGCLPVVVQFPVLIALYQAIYRTSALKQGTFLWMQLGKPDPFYVMAILAAIFTFGTTYLSTMSQPKNSMTNVMMWGMPLIIFFTAMNIASAVSIYWVVTNAFSVFQTLLIQRPFSKRREQQEKVQEEKDHEKALAKARKRALKRHK